MRTPRYDITPDRFMRITYPLPRQRCNVAVDNHTFVNALPWMYRTGAPWRELPECHGKWVTVCQRFNRRSRNGATGRLFAALQEKRINGAESQPHQTFCFLFPAFVPCPMQLGSMGVPASSAAPRIPVG